MAAEMEVHEQQLNRGSDSEVDDPEMNKLRDIIRNLEKTQSLLTNATDADGVNGNAAGVRSEAEPTKVINESANVQQRATVTNDATTAQQNGVSRRTSRQTSRKGSRGGSPSRDQTVPNSTVSRNSQLSEDDDDFEFEENEAAANADDESWLVCNSNSNANLSDKKVSGADAAPQLNGNTGSSVSPPRVAVKVDGHGQGPTLVSSAAPETSKPLDLGGSVDISGLSINETAAPIVTAGSLAELRRLVQAQEAEMRREAFLASRTSEAAAERVNAELTVDKPEQAPIVSTDSAALAVSTNNLDLTPSNRSFAAGNTTSLSMVASGSASNLQPSGSFQQLQYVPHGSVSSTVSARQSTGPRGTLNSASRPSYSSQPRSHSVTRGSATDLSAELRTVIDPARIFDADEKLELQKAQSSGVLNKAGVTLTAGRRPLPSGSANRNTSLVGRATSGRPASLTSSRSGSQPPATRLSLTNAQRIMPSEQIDLANYNEVAASAPSIPGATVLSTPYTLASAQRRGIAASASRVSATRTTSAQPVSLVRAVAATGRPPVKPLGAPMQRASSQPLRSSTAPTVRRPVAPPPANSRSVTGSLSSRSSVTVTRSSSATPLQSARASVPRTVSASFAQRSATGNRMVTPLSARSTTVRGRPGTAPSAPRTTTPLTRGVVRPVGTRAVTPLTKGPLNAPRQPLAPGLRAPNPRVLAPGVQRTPIPLGVMQRGRGAVAVGTVTRTGVVPLGARMPLPRPATAPLRVSAPMATRTGPSLTRQTLQQHTMATALAPSDSSEGLLMANNGQQQSVSPNAISRGKDDESWKDDCF